MRRRKTGKILAVCLAAYAVQVLLVLYVRTWPLLEREKSGKRYSIYAGQKVSGLFLPVLGLIPILLRSPLTLEIDYRDGSAAEVYGYDFMQDIYDDYPFLEWPE